MKRLIIVIGIIAAFLVPSSAPASAATSSTASVQAVSACKYKKVVKKKGKKTVIYWRCITPGAFCPKAARYKYGYAKVTSKRYKCLRVKGDTNWRWKRF